ncbi:MAG: xanthine dehydrogenase family protein molybdopterin-binding subunit [Betaproteobacteria bacterium]|nr:MAG: xanthine dehydrogenase family protein molybdopterin-binding subunit [Betaproteobacteria bacterium]
MSAIYNASRRGFLKTSALAGGGLLIGFTLPGASRLAQAVSVFSPNAYLRIGSDNQITVICGLSEMGQGVHTAIPMLVAEELDADWSKIKVEQAEADPAFNNPIFGMQATGGSTSVRGHWEPMRKAGAAARAMLVAAAAERWNADPADCRTEKGMVVHKSGKKLSYGQLAAAAAKQPVPAQVQLKSPKAFRILGRAARRLDTPAKVNGSAKFGLDVRLPGMLTAVMARPPVPGGKLVSVDDSKAKAIAGVKQVLQIPGGVAVLAEGYWAAKQGRDALQIKWDDGANAALLSDAVSKMLAEGAAKGGALGRNEGDVGAPVAKRLEAVYEAPFLAHACMEPMNATVWVKPDEIEVWAGTQSQGPSQGILGEVAGVAPGKVKVHTMYLGGGFGRRFAPDFTVDATLLSKISGKPVQLVYTREDDMKAYFYRPASVARFAGGLDANGKAVSFSASICSPSLMEASGFMKLPADGVDEMAVEGIRDCPYDFPNLRVEYARREPGVQIWFWRSVGHSQNLFFIESFVDEMAAAAGKDPCEFRLGLLGKQPRFRGVLELAAKKAGWGKPLPAGVHRGIAVAHSFGSYVAEVAEVSVGRDGKVRVHRVVGSVDCGLTVNPEIVKRQIESAIVYGLSAALYGKITFKDGRVEQSNFHDYPVLRIDEMPKVEVHIVASTEPPGGIGEPGLPPVAPAVANAIFAATGKRVRKLPIKAEELKQA